MLHVSQYNQNDEMEFRLAMMHLEVNTEALPHPLCTLTNKHVNKCYQTLN